MIFLVETSSGLFLETWPPRLNMSHFILYNKPVSAAEGWDALVKAPGAWFYYKLDEATGAVADTVTDYSGNARDGTINSLALSPGGTATGISTQQSPLVGGSTYSWLTTNSAPYNTVQPYIVPSETLTTSTPYQFSVMAVIDTATVQNMQIVSADLGGGSSFRAFQTALDSSGFPIIAVIDSGGSADILTGPSVVADGNVHVLHFVYDGTVGTVDTSRLRIYVDGALVANKASSIDATPFAANNVNVLDRGGFGGWLGFIGAIDEVAFYTTALTDQQVLDMYNARNA